MSCDVELSQSQPVCPACGADPLLGGRYRLEEIIGRGAHGTVYRATDAQSAAVLAIKELPLRHGLGDKQQELFAREASVLRQLSHPSIPRYHGELIAGEGKSRALYLLQAFVPGRPLSSELATHRYTDAEVRDIIAEVAGTLAYLHRLSPPVIHRDIKPSNLMRRPDGGLSLIDFGAVRDALRDASLGGSTVAGTFGYMAPEQFMGDASPATDIFGLGVTALVLLSRQEPAALYTRAGELRWEDALPPRCTLRPLLRQMLAPDPDDRLQDAAALLEALATAAPEPVMEAASPQRPPQARLAEPAPSDDRLWVLEDDLDQPLQVRPPRKRRGRKKHRGFALLMAAAMLFAALKPMLSESEAQPGGGQAIIVDTPPAPVTEIVPPPLLHQVKPQVPAADMRARGVAEETCSFLYTINADGSVDVQGVTSSTTCSDAAYASGHEALSQWKYAPPGEPMKYTMRFTFRVK